ncbi:unnamed protein product [Chondrus crispus]|uniref:Uncharacterized protein n=1 Tax=Chondrus crispus TaxID=2769 RepID=R7QC47_CHOCR|nr:unnamed protein product [Chondrus crispus]CDF35025.1 unnamed protein product [Chondrus crispus]|eukprot:XP_005714844.1 unnamed protein product [Chondrus crispus]
MPRSSSSSSSTHQRQALAWMQDRESDAHDKPAGHPRGGILADDQGFGKTLSVISLMITNQPPMRDGATRPPAWGNLVICPTSIMHQWASELDARIDAPYKPRVLVYHGAKRPKDPYVLVKYDVIVTSYGMARQEYPKVLERDKDRVPIRRRKKGPLYRLKWFRVILDEAQAIKNHRGDTFSACTLLQADRRWSLSGTPIQNTVDDIYSQFLFIRYFLVADYSEWRRKYKRPLESSRGSREALFKRFQATLGVVLLRRAKSDKIDGKPVIELPKRIVTLRELEFSKIERDYYQAQEDRAVEAMARFGIREGFTTALTILLRLRQACGHPDLCDWGGDRNFNFSEEELDAVDRRMMTSSLPGTEVQQTCPICIEFITENGVVTKCGHVFCTPDFDQWNRNNDSCPSCRAGLGAENEIMSLAETKPAKLEITIGGKRNPGDSFDESPTKRRCKGEKNAVAVDFGNESSAKKELKFEDVMEEGNSEDALEDGEKQPLSSTKIMAFLSEYDTILNATEDKVLCYSQWTRMLDLVEDEVLQRGHEYVRLDGTMSPHQRSAAINTFNTKDKCRLFLISMQAGSTGLNLTAANRVFLLDSWWNPTVEEQAIDRAHRIGQRKDVDVVRFKIHNSVEDKILALQERKRELINGALGVEGLKTMGRRRLTFRDVMSLFTDVASNVAARAGAAQNTELQNFAHIVQDAQLDMGL